MSTSIVLSVPLSLFLLESLEMRRPSLLAAYQIAGQRLVVSKVFKSSGRVILPATVYGEKR